ncbi:MAG: 50S ribosomal protein P1 [archaeon]|nr:50S ribosomal protein P1 [archaeon]
MESVYAALLLHKAAKKITEANLEKVLKAAGAEVDANQLKTLVAGLEGKNIDDLVANAAAVAPVAAAAPAAGGKKAPKKEKKSKKKEEKKEEKEEPTGIGALFG